MIDARAFQHKNLLEDRAQQRTPSAAFRNRFEGNIHIVCIYGVNKASIHDKEQFW